MLSVSGRLSRLTSSVGRNGWFATGQALEGRRESSHLRARQHLISSTNFCGNNMMSSQKSLALGMLETGSKPRRARLMPCRARKSRDGGQQGGCRGYGGCLCSKYSQQKLALVWPTFRVPGATHLHILGLRGTSPGLRPAVRRSLGEPRRPAALERADTDGPGVSR